GDRLLAVDLGFDFIERELLARRLHHRQVWRRTLERHRHGALPFAVGPVTARTILREQRLSADRVTFFLRQRALVKHPQSEVGGVGGVLSHENGCFFLSFSPFSLAGIFPLARRPPDPQTGVFANWVLQHVATPATGLGRSPPRGDVPRAQVPPLDRPV